LAKSRTELRSGNRQTMPLFRQLELSFAPDRPKVSSSESHERAVRSRDAHLEQQARELLRANGARPIAAEIQVEWNPRLKTAAGRADYKRKRISLNPLLQSHGVAEIDRTFRHELAHLLAQFRAGRRRILPHGEEWRQACRDLAIGDEKRCHTLPFPVRHRSRRYLYRCPNCRRDFPRVRRIRCPVACLACCRTYSKGRFDKRFRLRLVPCSGGL